MKYLIYLTALAVVIILVACSSAKEEKKMPEVYITTPSGLKYLDLIVGEGDTPKTGQKCSVLYKGMLEDSTLFDSALDVQKPFTYEIGKGVVIPGFDEGVSTMRVGGKRRLLIPPELGYGSRRISKIPPNSTLIFEVELVGIK